MQAVAAGEGAAQLGVCTETRHAQCSGCFGAHLKQLEPFTWFFVACNSMLNMFTLNTCLCTGPLAW
jgi:hypothetical protein